jgi:hypothetical protein
MDAATDRALDRMVAFHRRWRFLVLLGALTLLLCLQPVASQLTSLRLFDALLSVVVMAAVLSLAGSRARRWIGGLAGGAVVALLLAGETMASPGSNAWVLAGHLAGAVFLFGSALVTVGAALRRTELSLDSVFAAVCGYLLLGVAWAILYSAIDLGRADAFHMSEELLADATSPERRMSLFVYFSFVTLATLGYGDISPVSLSARTLAWIEAVLGQFYIAVLVAGLVGALIARNPDPRARPAESAPSAGARSRQRR